MKVNWKSKKFIILCSVSCLILIFAVTVICVAAIRSEHTGNLYYESKLNFQKSYITEKLSAEYNGGENIRVWFANDSSEDVNITIIRCGLFSEQVALTFSVDAGEQDYRDYFDTRAENYKYKICLESTDTDTSAEKNIISGELRIRQL